MFCTRSTGSGLQLLFACPKYAPLCALRRAESAQRLQIIPWYTDEATQRIRDLVAAIEKSSNDVARSYEEFVKANRSLVSIVDDDESVRESLPDLLKEFGFDVQAFSSGEAFLASQYVCETRCLILDVAMPGMSGPAVQQELMRRRKKIPIVFITAHSGEDIRPQLLQQGAIECLSKPFSDAALREALNSAFRTK